ncbi:MAG TPA: GNAT family N-acetyltransferase [Xanthobacteraceae bacterium]|jgi:phosphinothricin acetyltransferase
MRIGPLRLRDSCDDDVVPISRIYGHWVEHGLASFELKPPSVEEVARRRETLIAGRYPYLVIEGEGGILGYAYAGPYRTRPAYRFACEDSVYIAPDAAGQGIGRRLLEGLIARCETSGFRLMVAVIGDSGNAASIGLHNALGFSQAGILPCIGWKHERWVDSFLMTRPLGEGSASAPVERLL